MEHGTPKPEWWMGRSLSKCTSFICHQHLWTNCLQVMDSEAVVIHYQVYSILSSFVRSVHQMLLQCPAKAPVMGIDEIGNGCRPATFNISFSDNHVASSCPSSCRRFIPRLSRNITENRKV
jgi:hypothetical protein